MKPTLMENEPNSYGNKSFDSQPEFQSTRVMVIVPSHRINELRASRVVRLESRAGESPQNDIKELIWSDGISTPIEYLSSDCDCHFGVALASHRTSL